MPAIHPLTQVRHAAVEACTTAARASRAVVNNSLRLVQRHPRSSLVGAVALGLLATWALRHRPTPVRITGRRPRG